MISKRSMSMYFNANTPLLKVVRLLRLLRSLRLLRPLLRRQPLPHLREVGAVSTSTTRSAPYPAKCTA